MLSLQRQRLDRLGVVDLMASRPQETSKSHEQRERERESRSRCEMASIL